MITPWNIYDLAVWLYSELDAADPDEALIRTIMGRAYYAVFVELRKRSGISGKGGWVHGDVREFYLRQGGHEGEFIVLRLQRLREMGNRADYDDETDIFIRDAAEALSIFRDISDTPLRL